MTISELLVGKRVMMTKDCGKIKKGFVSVLRTTSRGVLYVEKDDNNSCTCVEIWQLIDPISYTPKPHKHTLICSECGESGK